MITKFHIYEDFDVLGTPKTGVPYRVYRDDWRLFVDIIKDDWRWSYGKDLQNKGKKIEYDDFEKLLEYDDEKSVYIFFYDDDGTIGYLTEEEFNPKDEEEPIIFNDTIRKYNL